MSSQRSPCSGGIVRGRQATCFFSTKDALVNAGARYVDAEGVRDGNLITSRVPEDLPAFCHEVIAALEGVSAGAGPARP